MLNPNEVAILDRLLEDYGAKLSCAGCTDFKLDDTPANRRFVEAMIAWSDPSDFNFPQTPVSDDWPLNVHDGKIMIQDSLLVGYLRSLLKGK